MMKLTRFAFLAGLALVFGLAGCSKPSEDAGADRAPAPAASIANVPQALAHPQGNPPTTRELLAYYSAHLVEAKQKWQQCQAVGVQNISAADRPTCVAAQAAWANQPYKPGQQGVK